MSAPVIIVTPKGDRSRRLLARFTSVPDLQVGQVLKVSLDGQPEEWRAWLWSSAGQRPPLTTAVEALTRPSTGEIEDLLNRRVERDGAWWA
jgi:hypothetical protein